MVKDPLKTLEICTDWTVLPLGPKTPRPISEIDANTVQQSEFLSAMEAQVSRPDAMAIQYIRSDQQFKDCLAQPFDVPLFWAGFTQHHPL
jgi:hypothetical protein